MNRDFDNQSQVWEKNWQTKPRWGGYPNEMIVRFFSRHIQNRPEVFSVLEVGCGAGNNLWFYAREGMKVYGIDGSEAAIIAANERLNKEKPGWKGALTIGNMTSLPYPENAFDFVIDVESISCLLWRDAQQVHQEINRVLKPTGKYCSIAFAEGCWGEGTGQKIDDNAWIVTDGPVATGGITRFLKHEMVSSLISPLVQTGLNLTTRSVDNLEHVIKEWVIEASPRK